MIGLIKPFQDFALCTGSNQRQRRAWEQESIQDYHIHLIGSDTNIAVNSLPTTALPIVQSMSFLQHCGHFYFLPTANIAALSVATSAS